MGRVEMTVDNQVHWHFVSWTLFLSWLDLGTFIYLLQISGDQGNDLWRFVFKIWSGLEGIDQIHHLVEWFEVSVWCVRILDYEIRRSCMLVSLFCHTDDYNRGNIFVSYT
jgi:hypothetical protein